MKYDNYETWISCLRFRAQSLPDKTAFTYLNANGNVDSALSFSDLDCKARSLSAFLLKRCEPGDRVLLLYPPGIDYIVAFYACVYANVVAVPLYSPQNNRKIKLIDAIASNCDASLALSTEIYVNKLVANKHCVEIINSINQRISWVATDSIGLPDPDEWQRPVIDGSSIAYLQYTSGSTSIPKGVVLNHKSTLYNSQEISNHWDTTDESVIVSWLPHFHDLGQVFSILHPIYKGACCVLMSPASFVKKPLVWLQAIMEYEATHVAAPNFSFDQCVATVSEVQKKSIDLSSLRTIANGAEPVRASTLKRFYEYFKDNGLQVNVQKPSYGLAEATLLVTSKYSHDVTSHIVCNSSAIGHNKLELCEDDDPEAITMVSCGNTVGDTKVYIVDQTSLQRCPDGEIGEIWVSSAGLGSGYWENEEETNKTFRGELDGVDDRNMLRTGDLGFLFKGDLYVTGRIKDLIIIRGSNHYPQDIELSVEASHPLLRDGHGAAFSVDVDGKEKLYIAVERERYYPGMIDYKLVFKSIREAVSRYHNLKPFKIFILRTGSISKTTSGKIQRQKCKNDWLSNRLVILAECGGEKMKDKAYKDNSVVASTLNLNTMMEMSIREWLVKWISNELKIPKAELDFRYSFSACGLCSVDTLMLQEHLEDWLAVEISPDIIWDSESVYSFIREISSIKIMATYKENTSEEISFEQTVAVTESASSSD